MAKKSFYKLIGIIAISFSFFLQYNTPIGIFHEMDLYASVDWSNIYYVHTQSPWYQITFLYTLLFIRISILISLFYQLRRIFKGVIIFSLILNLIAGINLRLGSFWLIWRLYVPFLIIMILWVVLSFKFIQEEEL